MELEEMRLNKGLTYEELATQLGLSVGTVFRICKKKGCIRLSHAHKIVKSFGGVISYEDLLIGQEAC